MRSGGLRTLRSFWGVPLMISASASFLSASFNNASNGTRSCVMYWIKGSLVSSPKSSALRSSGVVEGDSPGLPTHTREGGNVGLR